jgi:hypothetical protein
VLFHVGSGSGFNFFSGRVELGYLNFFLNSGQVGFGYCKVKKNSGRVGFGYCKLLKIRVMQRVLPHSISYKIHTSHRVKATRKTFANALC